VFSGINQAVSYGLLYFTLACVLYFGVTGSLTGRYKTITNKPFTSGLLVAFLFLIVSLLPNIIFAATSLSTLFEVKASSRRLVELMDVPITEAGTEIPYSLNKG